MTTQTEETLYIPKGCVSLAESVYDKQIRLGIQGKPGSGKTYSSLSAPNCVVTNFDRGLVTHTHRTDVIEVPFHDPKFVESLVKKNGEKSPPNRKDAFIKWLETEAMKLTSQQTLVIDSNKQIEVAFHTQYNLDKQPSSTGSYNKFEEWTQKITYFGYMGTLLKSLSCSVIYIAHETPDRDAEGRVIGLKPMLTGQAGDNIAGDFTDWYRAVTLEKPKDPEKRAKILREYGIDEKTLVEWIASTDTDTIYLWQTQSDSITSLKTSMYKAPRFVPAVWGMFNKYKKQQ